MSVQMKKSAMANPFLPSQHDTVDVGEAVGELLLIAGPKDPVLDDYAAYASRTGGRSVSVITSSDYLAVPSYHSLSGVALFLERGIADRDRELIKKVAAIAIEKGAECVCLISSFRVHFGDRRAIQAEEWALNCLRDFRGRVVVFRPSHIISDSSPMRNRLRQLRLVAAAVPARFRTCFLDGDELFAAIEKELGNPDHRKRRTFTLLGPNQSWKEVLTETSQDQPPPALARLAAVLLRFLLLGQLTGLLFDFSVRWLHALRVWNFDTLRPASVRELLSLYNKYNYHFVKIVGYNNGVVHFGHRYPGKTIVSTVGCQRVARVREKRATFDSGVTIRQAMEFLQAAEKELHVVPNYSYVSIGTAFFIPIHGSASDYCTVAETIEKVLLFDPVKDRFIVARRTDTAFGEYVYNLSADVLLRLTLRVKEKTRYYVKAQTRTNLTSLDILDFFHDAEVSNVEIRKAGAASPEVKVYQYYTNPTEGDSAAQELPRDRLGSLWDKLEANSITSVLFHALVRRFAHHVELFLPKEDFTAFWETHGALPLSKIQLRYIRRDGFPNSPFREHDCVSVDLFMLKKHKKAFEAYVKKTFRAARTNPGKHSM
jgi:hypothetical protein